jgi:nuclease HARBI1
MIEALEILAVFVTQTGSKFSAVEAFCLLCARLCLAGDLYALSLLYDWAQSTISEVVNGLVEYLDEQWEHLLGCDSDHLLHPSQLLIYANAIHQ